MAPKNPLQGKPFRSADDETPDQNDVTQETSQDDLEQDVDTGNADANARASEANEGEGNDDEARAHQEDESADEGDEARSGEDGSEDDDESRESSDEPMDPDTARGDSPEQDEEPQGDANAGREDQVRENAQKNEDEGLGTYQDGDQPAGYDDLPRHRRESEQPGGTLASHTGLRGEPNRPLEDPAG